MLETERLRLVNRREEHWRDLLPIVSDAEVVRYVRDGSPWSKQQKCNGNKPSNPPVLPDQPEKPHLQIKNPELHGSTVLHLRRDSSTLTRPRT